MENTTAIEIKKHKPMKMSTMDWVYLAIFMATVAFVVAMRLRNGFGNILWIADISTLFGVAYAIFLAKGRFIAFPLNIISTIILGVISVMQAVWLNGVLTLLIALPMTTLAMFNYKKNQIGEGEAAEPTVKRLSAKQLMYLLPAMLGAIVALMLLLYYVGGNVWYLDALVFVTTATALVLLSNQYLEMFHFFLLANAFNIAMFIMLSFQNINNMSMLFLFGVFTITNAIGLYNWLRMYRRQQETKKSA
ncbi:MAG: nicotinamide riboside transporter PnuC [Firmicutes bacterium]|nr:nicotinamide riboside transporter PnuC [Bacillota bacterium]